MNRNQKIALGCGGAGCLGLIVLIIIGILWWLFISSSVTNRNGNYNFNTNSNSNANTNRGSNTNANRNSNLPSNSNSVSSSSSSSSISDDDKHRLYHAAGITKDNALIQRVLKKFGFLDDRGATTAEYETFVKEHWNWALKNTQFVLSINSEEKARAYINEHLD